MPSDSGQPASGGRLTTSAVGRRLVFAFQLRPLFVLATAALGHLLRSAWREHVWPEIRLPPPVPDDGEPWTELSEG